MKRVALLTLVAILLFGTDCLAAKTKKKSLHPLRHVLSVT